MSDCMIRINRLALSALLIPGIAVAQPPEPPDPNEPELPADQPPPAPEPQPIEDSSPTVIVNPPARATVIATEPAYETVQRPMNAAMFASGAITFGAAYGASVIAAASVDRDEREAWAERLYVPVVGPWLALRDHGDCPIANPACDRATTTKVLLVADGILQGAGVLTMLAGLVTPSYTTRPVRTTHDTKVRVRPTVGQASGLTVFGRF
jgi:hypothetical protein